MDSVITAKNLTLSYDNSVVLENLSFEIKEGEYVGIVGPNGGGKTTLMKVILGLIEPTSGELNVFGNPSCERAHRSMIGYVPQRVSNPYAFFPATVEEVVRGGRASHVGFFGMENKSDAQAVKEALEEVQIAHLKQRLIYELSGGERQRVFIARALARRPRLLIFDEPTTGVDIKAQKQFYEQLESLNKKGITILLISHDVDVVAQQVGMVLCLNRQLVCHVKANAFTQDNYLEKIYGKNMKYVFHH